MLETFVKHFRLILVWAMLVGAVALLVSLLFPKQYSAESQVLIISRDRSGVDPYTQAKSAERIGESLAGVMRTDDFYQKVLESTSGSFDKERWQALSDRARRKQWQQDVGSEIIYNTGLLKIVVYSDTREGAQAFSAAVTDTVASRGWEYVGGDVALKVVNKPLVSRWQARPNLATNAVVGFLVGGALAAVWVARYRKHSVFGRV